MTFLIISRLVLAVAMTLLGGWLFFSAAKAIKTGVANAGGRDVILKKSPAFFAATIVAQVSFGLMMCWAALQVVLELR